MTLCRFDKELRYISQTVEIRIMYSITEDMGYLNTFKPLKHAFHFCLICRATVLLLFVLCEYFALKCNSKTDQSPWHDERNMNNDQYILTFTVHFHFLLDSVCKQMDDLCGVIHTSCQILLHLCHLGLLQLLHVLHDLLPPFLHGGKKSKNATAITNLTPSNP